MVLWVILLGAPRLSLANGTTFALERKDAALLAMLALDGPCAQALAASRLWPDASPGQARTNLRQRLFRMRKQVDRDVVLSRGHLQLAPYVHVDIIEIAAALPLDPAAGQGELLGDLDYAGTGELERWVAVARERWRQTLLELLASLAAEHEANHQIVAALSFAGRIVSIDPLSEHAHRRVMRLHYLRGDTAAALQAYRRCHDALRGELNAAPDPETDALLAIVQAGEPLAGAKPRTASVTLLRPPALIGRTAALEALMQAVERGMSVVVTGEPGMGKTRLLRELESIRPDTALFEARPGDTGLPYSLLARLVRELVTRFSSPREAWCREELARIAPELGPPSIGPVSALRLQQALAATLSQWRDEGLRLLVVDDIHHADHASLELLPSLITSSAAPSISWVMAKRQGDLPVAVEAAFDVACSTLVDRLALDPLTVTDVKALLTSLQLPETDIDGLLLKLVRHAGGNPLFLLETLNAMRSRGDAGGMEAGDPLPRPERIMRLIQRRIESLSGMAQDLARVAAVAGQDFGPAVAGLVLGKATVGLAPAWHELEGADVLRGHRFAHDLVHESVLRSLPGAIATELHRQVATALKDGATPAARMAAHWAAAKDWNAAGDAFRLAAAQAFTASRRIEEAGHWDQAVACYERAGALDEAFEARCLSIDTCLATRPVASVLQESAALYEAATGASRRLDAALALTKCLLTAGHRRQAVKISDEAVALAEEVGTQGQSLAAAGLSALSLSPGPRALEGIERLREFATVASTGATPLQRCNYLSDLATALHLAGRLAEAAEAYPLALAAARDAGDISTELIAASNLSGLLGLFGRIVEGREHAERAKHLLERVGDPDGVAAAATLINIAAFDTGLGRLGRAIDGYEEARQKLGGTGGTPQHAACETHLANLWLQLGQPSRALQVLKPIPAAVTAEVPQRQARRLTIEARINRALGQPRIQQLDRALELFGADADVYLRMLTELDRAREIDPDAALQTCQRIERDAMNRELLAVAMRARVLWVEAACRSEHYADAADMAQRSMTEWDQCRPSDLYWPEAAWIAYRAFDAAGDVERAHAVLKPAAEWISRALETSVAAPFRESFLHRNTVNRDVLAAYSRMTS